LTGRRVYRKKDRIPDEFVTIIGHRCAAVIRLLNHFIQTPHNVCKQQVL